VKKVFTILIADRNPRVRGFLQRELSREGYRILLAENARDLLAWSPDRDPVDLVILDPDLPDAVDAPLMSMLRQRMPLVPVIIHAHPSHHQTEPEAVKPAIVVEKGGSSVERLKEVAEHLLKGSQPAGFNTLNETPFER
jgi:DNA-binding NtrC family response regulator